MLCRNGSWVSEEEIVLHIEFEEPAGLGSEHTDEAMGVKHSSKAGLDVKIGIISICTVYLLLTEVEPLSP